jgi:translation elongation factor EF-1beta
MDPEINIREVMSAVKNALDGAKEYHLEVEVMAFAFKELKEDPTISIDEAISRGYYEWVK